MLYSPYMEAKIQVTARAKVNLSLNIVGVRGRRHLLESVMASVDIGDDLDIRFRDDGKTDVRFLGADVPAENTVTKALTYLRTYMPTLGASVTVHKSIPIAGGVGGSSADAAGVIAAAVRCFPASLDEARVYTGATAVGSDVPGMCRGGVTLLRGEGEDVRALPFVTLPLVIARGEGGVSTAAAYGEFDRLTPSLRHCPTDTQALLRALECGDVARIAPHLQNALTDAAVSLLPNVAHTLQALRISRALAVWMTGSGSCCCGLYATACEASAAAASLRAQGLWAQATETVPDGVRIS